MTDLVMHTFELAAGRTTDITADVYRRYYDRAPDSQALMSHVDHYMQGRMLDEVLTLLMTEAAELPEGYLHFEVANHASYGVQLDMYRHLFEAVRESVQALTGDDWDEACAEAWRQRIDELMQAINAAAPG